MAKKVVDYKNTLAYAVAFLFPTNVTVDFFMGTKMYQHIKTVYDYTLEGNQTLEVVYDYYAHKYAVLHVKGKLGEKEIRIQG